MRVTSSSWVGWARPIPNSIASNTRRTVPIWRSHTPPKCDACGGWNIHSQPCSAVNLWIRVWSISKSASSNCDFLPTKLVPWSHLSFATGPRMAKNRRCAQMNELASIVFNTSMWMARLLRQVKMSPQRLAFATPPLSLVVMTSQGPKTSNPTFVKGGLVSIRSDGRFVICCVKVVPLNFLQVTQDSIRLATIRCPPVTQKPASRTAPRVICLPWW